jgi:hypothetical protein
MSAGAVIAVIALISMIVMATGAFCENGLCEAPDKDRTRTFSRLKTSWRLLVRNLGSACILPANCATDK